MPFYSLNPGLFHNPKSCALVNGTTVYSNRSIATDCSCVAPFNADPDLAGLGIIAFFCFMAWTTLLIAGIPVYYSLRQSRKRTREGKSDRWRLRQTGRFLCDALELKTGSEDQQIVPLSSQQRAANWWSFYSCSPEAEPIEPPMLHLAKATLVPLTDIQIITGFAYILTGASTINHISYYHEQFVVNIWWLTQNSLWVSRIDCNNDTLEFVILRYHIRRIIIFASVLISAVFQGIVAVRERYHWDPLQPGRCYHGNNDPFSRQLVNDFSFLRTTLHCPTPQVNITRSLSVRILLVTGNQSPQMTVVFHPLLLATF